MKYKYLIQIFTRPLQTKFEIEVDKEINAIEELHPHIIDFLGKSDIHWERNDFRYNSPNNSFYITYEEVADGSREHGAVREEIETRI